MVDYQAAIPIGLLIGAAFIALAYMIGGLLSSEPLRAYAKLELGNLILSAILVLIVVAAMDTVPGTLAHVLNINTSQFGVAEAGQSLHASLEVPLQNAINSLVEDTFRLTKIISYNYNAQLAVPGLVSGTYSASPGAGASPLTLQLQTGMDTTSLTMLLVRGVRVGAMFLDYAVLVFLLPIAIILRFIPPTRKLGGLLMGIGLAVHLVYPASVGMSLELWGQFGPSLSKPINPIADPGTPPGRGAICSPLVQGLYTAGEVNGPLLICAIACLPTLLFGGYPLCLGKAPTPAPFDPSALGCSGILGDIWYFAELAFPLAQTVNLINSPLALNPDQVSQQLYHPLVDTIMPAVVDLNLSVILLIVIQLAATIILAREFAMLLGGEGQFYGLAKLV